MIFDKSTPFNDIETNRVNCCADMGNKRRAINDKASSTQLSPSVYNRHCNFLTQTKVAVKRCMEEAATKKLIYIDSSTVNVLCGAVENCVLDSLQRRTIGLFEDLHSTALLKKISKECDAAASIINKMKSFSDSTIPYSAGSNGRFFPDNENLNPKSQNTISLPNTFSGLFTRSKPEPMKYLWIKMALLEKKLVDIMDYLIEHHMSFYDETSIMSSSLSGSLLIELIAGPCSLDFSLVKPSDHLWTDPDASELLDRHNIHSKGAWANHLDRNIYKSGLNITRSIKNRPNLKIQHHTSPSLRMQDVSTNCTFGNIFTMTGQPVTGNVSENKSLAKDYVESLHQNMKNVLLYGKNNVIVQPKDDLNEMQGYLSLHQTFGDKLRLKWTPNQLMNYQTNKNIEYENDNENLVYQENNDIPNQLPLESPKLLQWDSALLIKFENIVYLHVHQNEDKSGKVTLVCQDGVQYPPIRFPSGGHLLQFLTCLESGLSPAGKLEPPLLQIDDGEKSFPKLTRRRSNCSSLSDEDKNKYKTNKTKGFSFFESFNKSLRFNSNSSVEKLSEIDVLENDECIQSDFVFRIVYEANSNSTGSGSEINHDILNSSAESQNRDKNYIQWNLGIEGNETNVADSLNDSLTSLCSIMKRQILSRAFYGWLHYYRNLKTVRTQCNTLVHPGSVQSDVPCDASEGLTVEIWDKYKLNKDLSENELYRLIYFGGCAESLRNEVWPRMLGHYEWSSIDNSEIDSKTELLYEKSLSLWKAIEVIIKQRENEIISPLAVNNEEKNQLSSSHQTEMDSYTPCEPSMTYIATSRRRGSTITISNCDLTPSIGFYSTDNSFDATSSNNQDIAFQEDQLVIMADNMHRIDKDVDRCDRNYHYFSSNGQYRLKGSTNLKKLRNIMITWVWENIEIGYVQGMCDILAPLLVILDNEALTHACFTKLMKRMIHNFPQMGSNMDENLRTMALLLQIIDGDLYDHMCHDGEVTSLYVTYRWFLLDFKRELCYSDVFSVWETIWSAGHVASSCFNLFLALSLLYYYRDIILDNNMEYTDIIKFFNEMAEKHQVQKLLYIAREFIETIRDLLKPR